MLGRSIENVLNGSHFFLLSVLSLVLAISKIAAIDAVYLVYRVQCSAPMWLVLTH
jgi:hypothetical protein